MKNILTIYLIISIIALNILLLNIKKDSARLKTVLKDAHYVTLAVISFTPIIHLIVVVLAIFNKGSIDIYEMTKSWKERES